MIFPKLKVGKGNWLTNVCWANRVMGVMVSGPMLMGMPIPPPKAGITMSGTTSGPKLTVW
ncbi:Uncharacterised protein [Mycobacterium tuberculosis]|uniref:Uncharacterized protein n=1 Tax=Mycobacterium tuberculosis TaxID=1773 RepID=A0A0T9D0R1_MYCTX|nr:hypothetical protein RN09_4097 [Mycobacterium tuberculosis variant africanum]CFA28365.1 Uncharacterised protein [Mycobacterium tuberculosis]CFC60969.1 Uncharacterised protein [Mycobacterium tuberculosis]CFC71829.1 Uncharacterised protein [Mycobacterium tuberculosis]CFE49382.1 Uncharacterised protein [Mycobacterium tuberculosis]